MASARSLVADAEKARLELARIGFDDVLGYIEADSLTETQQLSQLSVCDLKAEQNRGEAPVLVDVRTPGEWAKHHIDGAIHIPLPKLPKRVDEVPRHQRVALMCGSGYRSSIAASLLQSRGFQELQNVMGGMSAYEETKCPSFEPAGLVFQGADI